MTRELNPIQNDAREVRRVERLGPGACCVLCGETELAALTQVEKKLLEEHHAVGCAYDKTSKLPLCRNCHAKATECLLKAGVNMDPPHIVAEQIVSVLRSLAQLFQSLAAACVRWADGLAEWLGTLDLKCPEWRS